MECGGIRHIVHPSRSDEFKIWYLSDLHMGAKASATKEIDKVLRGIESDPFSFWIGGGDYMDWIDFDDPKRFDSLVVDPAVLQVADFGEFGNKCLQYLTDRFAPIKEKCIGLLLGNHEKKFQQMRKQEHLHRVLCARLGVPDLGFSCFADISFQRVPRRPISLLPVGTVPGDGYSGAKFRIYAHHGAGGAQTAGGKINRLIRFMNANDADMYYMGHVHFQTAHRQTILAADGHCASLVAKEKVGVISGGFLMTYKQGMTGYGEMKGYEPTTIGAAWISVNPETRKLRAEV